ncbi:unnamed protein product [Urochloa humidicola]
MAPGAGEKKKILVARKGRLRQRYDGEYRLVAGCVPYRLGADGQPELLMVSTPNRDDLVFPKGGWEDDEDVHEAACREALEEAGVKGAINRTALGMWVFRSKSSPVSGDSPRGACKGYIFALEVTEEGSTTGRSRKPTAGSGSPRRTRTACAATTGCARRWRRCWTASRRRRPPGRSSTTAAAACTGC